MAKFRVSYETGPYDKSKLVEKTFEADRAEETEFGGTLKFFDADNQQQGSVSRVVLWNKVKEAVPKPAAQDHEQ